MSELDAVILFNPTNQDFAHHFNGELYSISANSSKPFAQKVGFHLAKHLATKMVNDSFSTEDKKDPKKSLMISQHTVYDNPKLRIALFKILKDKMLVQEVVIAYPYKGFIGEMLEYEQFVENSEKPKEPIKVG